MTHTGPIRTFPGRLPGKEASSARVAARGPWLLRAATWGSPRQAGENATFQKGRPHRCSQPSVHPETRRQHLRLGIYLSYPET